MLITRHIIYRDQASACWRQELRYDPPLEIDLSLGKVSSILNSQSSRKNRSGGSLRKCKPIVNANGILHINEVVKAGETISIVLRPNYRLKNVVLGEAHSLQALVDEQGFQYWFTIGQDGAFEMTGSLVRDDEGFFLKLQKNLKDIPFRAYIVQLTLADTKVTLAAHDKPPDLMDTKAASKYLGISDSTLYKKAQAGLIPRTPDTKFRRVDLDAYLAGSKRSGKQKTKLAK
jgi:predicted DNA-binding transcriptional regulator AlpA